jgi:hypothetical protein
VNAATVNEAASARKKFSAPVMDLAGLHGLVRVQPQLVRISTKACKNAGRSATFAAVRVHRENPG